MKVLKIIAILFAILIIFGLGTCMYLSKDLPEGIESPKSGEMIDKMWAVLDKQAWDTTRYVKWSFRGVNHYIWDKESNLAQISWKNKMVLLDPDKVEGLAFVDGKEVLDDSKNKLIQKAWSNWCNDMFWLTAPFKVKDPGTSHKIIEHEEGDRLRITYSSGGVTPGDTYIWIVDEEGYPTGYEMYVGIIPIKGIYVPWGDWVTISTGAKLSSKHTIANAGLELDGIQGGNSLESVGLEKDIWAKIR